MVCQLRIKLYKISVYVVHSPLSPFCYFTQFQSQDSSHTLTATEIRTAARRTALQQIDIQREEFRQLGVMADWDGDSGEGPGRGTYRTLGAHIGINFNRAFD
jgi:hypothetical protein